MRVAKVLIRNGYGETLVLRRSGTHPVFAYEPDLPGGIIEDGETYEAGLAREILEETGIVIDPAELKPIANGRRVSIDSRRLYEMTVDRPTVTLSWEHDAYEWVAADSLATRLESRDRFMTFARAATERQ